MMPYDDCLTASAIFRNGIACSPKILLLESGAYMARMKIG